MNRISAIAIAAILSLTTAGAGALAHGADKHFAAGAPGDPKKPSRTIEVVMREGDASMRFSPDHVDVKRGEQIRFVLKNDGQLAHEFMLATAKENAAHGKIMERFPDMEHDDPNGKRLDPGKTAEIVWRFTKAGSFEFACLIPGHHQAGMHGTITVK